MSASSKPRPTFSTLWTGQRGGREVVVTRHGKPVAKLVRIDGRPSDEVIQRRRKALRKIREIAGGLDIHMTHEEIKASIEEGRH